MTITWKNANEIGSDFHVHDGIITRIVISPLEHKIIMDIDISEWKQHVSITVKNYITFSTTDVSNAGYPRLWFGKVGVAQDFGVEMQNFDTQFHHILACHAERDVSQYVVMILESVDGDVLKAVCEEIVYDVMDLQATPNPGGCDAHTEQTLP